MAEKSCPEKAHFLDVFSGFS